LELWARPQPKRSTVDFPSYALVFTAAVAAGVVNSIAGGGTILTFPAALAAGLSPIVANATNCVALVPGALASAWAYRRELERWGSTVRLLIVATGLGGLVGAAVLLATPERWFDAIVPWLIFTATLLVVFQGPLTRWTRRGNLQRVGPRGLALVLFGIGIYGGYFGAGQGIFMLGAFSLVLSANLHEMNALKVVAASFSNGFAAVYFLARGVVDGPMALTMSAGAIVGGFLGASVARRVNPRHVRVAIVVIGLSLTVVLLERAHRVVRGTAGSFSVAADSSGAQRRARGAKGADSASRIEARAFAPKLA
jgi:hypothetical protein